MGPKWDQNGTKMVPKWDQNGTKMEPKWDQNGTKMEPKWDQNGTKKGPKWNQNGTKMGPKWDQNETKMGPKWVPNGSQMGSPGLRAPVRHLSGTGPAPVRHRDPKSVIFVKLSSKQAPAPLGSLHPGTGRYQILGPPGESLKYPIRTLQCTTVREKSIKNPSFFHSFLDANLEQFCVPKWSPN